MPAIDTILLLLCFTVIPLAMVAILAYRVVRWIVDRRAVAALRAAGWEPLARDDRALAAALEDLRLEGPRARWYPRGRHGEGDDAVRIVTREVRGATSDTGSIVTYAIARRAPGRPTGVLSRRAGGVMEKLAGGFARALGPAPIEPPGWDWAIVSSPSTPERWSREAGAAMDALVRPGEHIVLGAQHLAIATIDRPLSEQMREARERLDAIREALS